MNEHLYACCDVESSGLFDYSKPADADGQPRMASLAILTLADDLSIADEFHTLIKPDGWEMDPVKHAGAIAAHGLTQEKLLAEGIPVAEALAKYTAMLDAGRVIVGYNVSYDLKVLRGELRRAGLPDRFETTASVDCMRPLTDICKIPKASGRGYKLPKLVEAYASIFKKDFEGAHGALADARACAEIFKEMQPRGIWKVMREQRGPVS